MTDTPDLRPRYAADVGWRRIYARLPQRLRLDCSDFPTEEWQTVGTFSVHLDCWRRPDPPASVVVIVHGGGGNGRLRPPVPWQPWLVMKLSLQTFPATG